jgi:RNA polymerase sigma factor (sigma-70 family)
MKWEPILGELDQRRRGRLIAFATLLADADIAEDLVHEAVIAVFSKTRGLTTVEQAEAYVRRAIATKYIDMVRKDRARSARERITAPRDTVAGPAETDPMSGTVAAALASLSPQVRACIVLRFLDDHSVRSTAELLNLSEGTVKRYVSDGLQQLNRRLGTTASLEALEVRDVVSHSHSQEVKK